MRSYKELLSKQEMRDVLGYVRLLGRGQEKWETGCHRCFTHESARRDVGLACWVQHPLRTCVSEQGLKS